MNLFAKKQANGKYAPRYDGFGGVPAEAYDGGTGTRADPFLIGSAAQLWRMADQMRQNIGRAAHYRLTSDITCNPLGGVNHWDKRPPRNVWTPIGDEKYPFSAWFDGGGHTIYGLYAVCEDGAAAFAGFAKYATICDLTIAASYFRGGNSTAAFIGHNEIAIDVIRCTNYATVVGCGVGVGGLLGGHASHVPDEWTWEYATDEDNGAHFTVVDCENFGTVRSENENDSYAGGMVGYINAGRSRSQITGCVNYGLVIGAGDAVGGIVGGCRQVFEVGHNDVELCTNYGAVVGKRRAGGIVGLGNECDVDCCVNHGKIVGGDVGGIVGATDRVSKADPHHIWRCASDGTLLGDATDAICPSPVGADLRDNGGDVEAFIANYPAPKLPVIPVGFGTNGPRPANPPYEGEREDVNDRLPKDDVLHFETNALRFIGGTITKNDSFLFLYNGEVLLADSGDSNEEALNMLLSHRERAMRDAGMTDEDIASPRYQLAFTFALSHYHGDHRGGLLNYIVKSPYLRMKACYLPPVSAIPVGGTTPDEMRKMLVERYPSCDMHVLDFDSVTTFMLGDAAVELLAPIRDFAREFPNPPAQQNNNSVWLHLTCNGRKFLLTGDTYAHAKNHDREKIDVPMLMIHRYGGEVDGVDRVSCDVFKPMHHGRITWSIPTMEYLRPKHTICCVYYGQDFPSVSSTVVKYGDFYHMGVGKILFDVTPDGEIHSRGIEPTYRQNADGYLIRDKYLVPQCDR